MSKKTLSTQIEDLLESLDDQKIKGSASLISINEGNGLYNREASVYAPIFSQQITSMQAAVYSAVSNGVDYNKLINTGGGA